MIQNPKTYWQNISEQPDWKNYILPRRNAADFDAEGFAEAQRLFYFFDNKSTVVDYGCGVGRVLKYVAERAGHVIGLDICEGFLDKARGLIKADNVEFFQAETYKEQEVADFVYCLMVMQHNDLLNQRAIIDNIFMMLEEGGRAIISFPRYESNYYQENETLHKFTMEEVSHFGDWFPSFRIIEGNLPGYANKTEGNNEYFLIATK